MAEPLTTDSGPIRPGKGSDLASTGLVSYFFKIFFFGGGGVVNHFSKVFVKFVTILLLFYVLVFWPQGTWDLSSPTGD